MGDWTESVKKKGEKSPKPMISDVTPERQHWKGVKRASPLATSAQGQL